MKRHTAAALTLLLVSIVWGAASPVVKHTLQWFSPWLFLTYRFFLSTLIGIPALAMTRSVLPKQSSARWLLLLTGFVSAPLSLFLYFEALNKTTALSGSLITASGPLFMIVSGVLFFRDRIRRNEAIGVTIAIIGTMLTVIGPLILNGHADTLGKLEGNTLMLLAVVTDVIGSLLSKEAVSKGIRPSLITHTQFILGFILFLPLLLLRQSPAAVWMSITTAPWQAHAGVLYMAVLSGTIAYTMRNIALKSIEVSESALYGYLQPLWGAIIAVIWLREAVTPSYLVGGTVIAIGVIIAEQKRAPRPSLKLRRRQKRK